MVRVHSSALHRSTDVNRVIGHLKGQEGGPTLVLVAGIHGNEPSGIFALRDLFGELQSSAIKIYGDVFALAGNLTALSKGVRYHRTDLNRLWTQDQIALLESLSLRADETDEAVQQRDLLKILQAIMRLNHGPFYFIDMHTTSCQSIPFMTVNDNLLNRKFTAQYPLPVVLGIEEYLNGPLLSYINDLGYVSFGYEGGQHEDPASIENHKAFAYLSLAHTGNVNREAINYAYYFDKLSKAAMNQRDIYEIYFRYQIAPGERFVMKPGFTNFQEIKKGTSIACSNGKDIVAARRFNIFMPLYQSQGAEAYFSIRKIPAFILGLSHFVRRLRLDRILPVLPGIRWNNRTTRDALRVNLKIARFLSKELFHLMGYRSRELDRDHLIIKNREECSRYREYPTQRWQH